jgi:hypothetical protein
MRTPVVSSMAWLPGVTSRESPAPAERMYRTKTSLVAVRCDEAGEGHILFLPHGAPLRVTGPSSILPEGLEVKFELRIYNVFEIDLVTQSILIAEPARAKGRAMAARA